MANTKISALTAATTPLAGTEVLPIVQSGVTKQVAISDLTAGRTVSVGNLSVSGSQPRITADMSNATQANRLFFQNSIANTSTSVGVMPNGSGTSSRLNLFNGNDPDNAGYLQAQISATNAIFNSSKTGTGTALPYVWQIGSVTYLGLGTTGDLTVNSGNLVQGTAAKGVNFTANTGAAGKTSQLLNWYEEGTWTPVLSASTPGNFTPTYTTQEATYTRVGRNVTVTGRIYLTSFTNTTGSGDLLITGLPFTPSGYYFPGSLEFAGVTKVGYTQFTPFATPGQTYLRIDCSSSATAVTTLQVTDLTAGGRPYFVFQVTYQV